MSCSVHVLGGPIGVEDSLQFITLTTCLDLMAPSTTDISPRGLWTGILDSSLSGTHTIAFIKDHQGSTTQHTLKAFGS
jgi:hypothetical protein